MMMLEHKRVAGALDNGFSLRAGVRLSEGTFRVKSTQPRKYKCLFSQSKERMAALRSYKYRGCGFRIVRPAPVDMSDIRQVGPPINKHHFINPERN